MPDGGPTTQVCSDTNPWSQHRIPRVEDSVSQDCPHLRCSLHVHIVTWSFDWLKIRVPMTSSLGSISCKEDGSGISNKQHICAPVYYVIRDRIWAQTNSQMRSTEWGLGVQNPGESLPTQLVCGILLECGHGPPNPKALRTLDSRDCDGCLTTQAR